MPPPAPLPPIPYPVWFKSRFVGGDSDAGGPPPPDDPGPAVGPDAEEVIQALLPYFASPDDQALLKALIVNEITVEVFTRMYSEDDIFTSEYDENGEADWFIVEKPLHGHLDGDTIKAAVGGPDQAGELAATIIHEAYHLKQPENLTEREREYEAFTGEEEFRIEQGLRPIAPECRMTDAAGNVTVNPDGIRAVVDRTYPETTREADDGTRQVMVGVDSKRRVILWDGKDTTTRDPVEGDFIPGPGVTEPEVGTPIDLNRLVRA